MTEAACASNVVFDLRRRTQHTRGNEKRVRGTTGRKENREKKGKKTGYTTNTKTNNIQRCTELSLERLKMVSYQEEANGCTSFWLVDR